MDMAGLGLTVREYFDGHADGWSRCQIAEIGDGWEIAEHAAGLTGLSPGTCVRELGYRDESRSVLSDLISGGRSPRRSWRPR